MAGKIECWKKMMLALLALIVFSLSSTEAYVVICRDHSVETNTVNGQAVTEFKMPGVNLDPKLCTHYIYKSIFINSSYHIQAYPTPDAVLKAIQQMKTKNRDLKILVGVDGLDSLTRLGSTKEIVDLTNSLNDYLFDNAFDGAELNILGGEKVKGLVQTIAKSFKELFVINEFALGMNYQDLLNVSSYDWTALKNSIDFLVLPTYNFVFTAPVQEFVLHPHPLKSEFTEILTVEKIVNLCIGLGYPAEKIVINIPTQGQRWKYVSNFRKSLVRANNFPSNDASYIADVLANQLSYRNICQIAKTASSVSIKQNPTNHSGPFMTYGTSPRYWVGYDDPPMASIKAEYIKTQNLFGACVIISPSVQINSSDDYDNSCGGGAYPITTAVSKVLMSSTMPETTVAPVTKPKTTKKPATKPKTTKKPTTKPKTTKKPTTKPKTTKKPTTKPKTTKKPTAKSMERNINN